MCAILLRQMNTFLHSHCFPSSWHILHLVFPLHEKEPLFLWALWIPPWYVPVHPAALNVAVLVLYRTSVILAPPPWNVMTLLVLSLCELSPGFPRKLKKPYFWFCIFKALKMSYICQKILLEVLKGRKFCSKHLWFLMVTVWRLFACRRRSFTFLVLCQNCCGVMEQELQVT